jgi:hypothetical protein
LKPKIYSKIKSKLTTKNIIDHKFNINFFASLSISLKKYLIENVKIINLMKPKDLEMDPSKLSEKNKFIIKYIQNINNE